MRGRLIFKILGLIGGIIFSAFLVGRVFVYDTNVAHPGLTKLAGELYNNQIAGTGRGLSLHLLTNQEINWLMQGAIEEDTPFRWMNHFYDPINNRGFKGIYDTAKDWATDANNQTMFSKGDQSWQRAIYEFQQGNKKQAFIALGHVLHLLEDMTVPAHTRDDAHPEGDPYEQWVKENFKSVSSQLIYFNGLNQYFDYLANFSNNNFYSKDTVASNRYVIIKVVENFQFQNSDGTSRVYFMSQVEGKNFNLYWSKLLTKWDQLFGVEAKSNEKYVDGEFINKDYFSLLAPKAIGAGAGVIKLFFETTARQKVENPTWLWQTNPLGYAQEPAGWMVSQVESLADKAKILVTDFGSWTTKIDFISELIKDQMVLAEGFENQPQNSVLPQLLAQPVKTAPLLVADDVSSVNETFSETFYQPSPSIFPSSLKPLSSPPASSGNSHNQEVVEDLLAGFVPTPLLTTPKSPSRPEVGTGSSQGGDNMKTPLLAPRPIVYGGSSYASFPSAPAPAPTAFGSPPPASPAGGSEGGDNTPPPPLDIASPTAPVFFQPLISSVWTSQTTTTLSAELSSDTYKIFFNNAEEIVSSTLWSREVNLAEGENIFELAAVDLAGNVSASSSVKIIKDATAPTLTIQSAIQQLDNSTINLSWSGDDGAGSGAASYDLIYQKWEIGQATSTEWIIWQSAATSTHAVFSGETGYQYQFRVRATDQLGNVGEWTLSETQSLALPKVVINEIAWGGTIASANDEWLELYNTGDYPVDLSGWILTDSGDINIVFPTSTLITAKGFYLLERTSDNTIKTINADLIYTGSLNNSGENLSLKDIRRRLIDEVKAGSGWFAGSSDSNKQSMERKDPLASGNLVSNWQSTPLVPRNGFDAQGKAINGTPKRPNSPFIFLTGALTADRIITADLNPYFLSTYTVASGTILTLGPGVVVKAGVGGTSWGSGNLLVYGKVVSQGTSEAPVIFTSYRDSAYAGNTNTWDSAITAGPGEWEHLIFYPGSQVDLRNTKILYGNYRARDTDPNGSLVVSGAIANLSGVTVSYARASDLAVSLTSASTTLVDSSLAENSAGLLIDGGVAIISQTIFENNATGLEAKNGANLIVKDSTFKSNGFKSGGLGPARIRDSVLKEKNNQFQNNSLNGFDWGGNLSGEQIIDNVGSAPLISSSLTVPAGSVLTIKAGSHLKMKTNGLILIQGALRVEGTESQPVIFTSYRDDSDGYDSNGDGGAQNPNPLNGEWYQLRFDSSVTSTLNYLNVLYANQLSRVSDPVGSVYINQTPVTADYLRIKYSRVPDGAALHLKNDNQVLITNSLVKNDYKAPYNPYGYNVGILIDAGAPIISNSNVDTFNYGLIRQSQPHEQLINVNFVNVDR